MMVVSNFLESKTKKRKWKFGYSLLPSEIIENYEKLNKDAVECLKKRGVKYETKRM